MSTTLPYSTGLEFSASQDAEDVLVDLADSQLYSELVHMCLQRTPLQSLKETVVTLDHNTAADVEVLSRVIPDLGALYLVGNDDGLELPHGDNVYWLDSVAEDDASDRFFAALGPATAFAATLREPGERNGNDNSLGGFWTTYSPCIEAIFENLVGPGKLLTDPMNGASVADLERSHLRMAQIVRRYYRSEQRQSVARPVSDLEAILRVMQAISAPGSMHDVLFVFVEQIASTIEVDRCSCVRVRTGSEEGHVLASHDDESVHDQIIDLGKYPELRRALSTGETILIDDTADSGLMRPVQEMLNAAGIASILVVPVILYDVNSGSLFLRAVKREGKFSAHDVNFCEIVAESTANAIERANLIETIQSANDRLERLAITDGLTELYNFRFFSDRLEKEFSRASRYGNPLGCVLYDVDDFKKLNDSFGHLEGDSVLKEIAEISRRSFRQSDIVARYGGEEIVALLPHTGLRGAIRQAERVRQEIGGHHFEGLPRDHRVTVSVGVAEIDIDDMNDCQDLVRLADESLYRAKELGKNRVIANQRKEYA